MSQRPGAPSWNDIPGFDIKEAGTYIGNNVYAFELNSSYLAGTFCSRVRLMAKKDIHHGKLTTLCLVGVGLAYYLTAASYLFVYSHE